MLTLEETLEAQKNLEQLCAERPLKTYELFPPNAFYGLDSILKTYAGLPQTYSLKAVMPHGIVFDETYLWAEERKAPLPAVFCYPPYLKEVYSKNTRKQVILTASPFLYVAEMLSKTPVPHRQGTIFFPHHSSHLVDVKINLADLAEKLACLGGEYQPITVCVYWKDFNLGRHLPFKDQGMRIVSAGHLYDSNFLYRFYHLCSMHKYAAGHSCGSHIFYAVKSGCSYFYIDDIGYSAESSNAQVFQTESYQTVTDKESELKRLFHSPQPVMQPEHLKIVDYYLGTAYMKSSQALKHQIFYAELLDKAGFFVKNQEHPFRFVIPMFFHRIVVKSLRRIQTMMRKSTSGS